MIILGIHGKRGTGKDTLARALKNRIHETKTLAFADKLKEVASTLFDIPLEVFHDETQKETYQTAYGTPRDIMITLSEALNQQYGFNLFLESVGRAIAKAKEKKAYRLVLVTDVRGEHAAEFIRAQGGTVVHIRRPNMPTKSSIGHWSEQHLEVKHKDVVLIIGEGQESISSAVDELLIKYTDILNNS